eukprot:2817059-Pyramimonas_sp.AAC.1
MSEELTGYGATGYEVTGYEATGYEVTGCEAEAFLTSEMTGCEVEAASAASGSEVAYEATCQSTRISKMRNLLKGTLANLPPLSVLGGFRWPRPAQTASKWASKAPSC